MKSIFSLLLTIFLVTGCTKKDSSDEDFKIVLRLTLAKRE